MKKIFSKNTMLGKKGKVLFEQCIDTIINENIEGDFVQCGVWRGGLAAHTLHKFREHGLKKKLYLFDTFEGMTEPNEKDEIQAHRLYQTLDNFCYASLEDVQNNLYLASDNFEDHCNLIVGPVEETLLNKKNLPESISMLHLDTDWYQSTKIELEVLFPLLSVNGILCVDDFKRGQTNRGWQGCTDAVNEYFENNKNFVIEPMPDMYHNKILFARKISDTKA